MVERKEGGKERKKGKGVFHGRKESFMEVFHRKLCSSQLLNIVLKGSLCNKIRIRKKDTIWNQKK